jgi:hypothetical protein
MSKIFHISVLLLAVVVLGSCGGGGSRQVTVSWNANRDKVVNKAGGGYILYYSQTSGFNVSDASKTDVPYVSGSTAPTSVSLSLPEGTWYLRLSAYGAWQGNTQYSEPCSQLTLNVGG